MEKALNRTRVHPALGAAIMLGVALLARAQTFGDPVLHLDEQLYLLVGDRMLHGALPYVDIWDRKPIGLFLIYAAVRLLGGDGIVQYQLVAAVCAAATGYLVMRLAASVASPSAAMLAGVIYILWLGLMGGDGGQAPVFYNLPMAAAALLVLRAIQAPPEVSVLRRNGALAMLLVGVAIQIKYTALFDGMFLGVALLWARRREGRTVVAILPDAALWIACALLPTAAAAIVYVGLGRIDAFVFANFVSILARTPSSGPVTAGRLAKLAAILAPLLVGVFAARLWRVEGPDRVGARFLFGWLAVSCAAVLGFGTYYTAYGLPVVLPASICAAASFDRGAAARRWCIAVAAVAMIAGQVVIVATRHNKGGRDIAAGMLNAMRGHADCLFVYEGQPILYLLGRRCIPTRFAFPGHFNQANEAHALGIDIAAETRRVLDTRPGLIATVTPAWHEANLETRRLVEERIARDYVLVYAKKTGKRVQRLHALRPQRMSL